MNNNIYLCKPGGDIVSALAIDEETVLLTENVSDLWELSFTIHRYLYDEENPYYNSLSEMMELFLDSEDCKARFVIDGEPSVSTDGTVEVKTVTAHSIEAELQYRFLDNFQVNTGQDVSQENLLKGDINGNPVDPTNITTTLYDYNLNPYTNLPIDYITVSCKLGDELEAFKNKLVVSGNNITIKWTFSGATTETSIPATFNTSTGQLSSTNAALLFRWYEEFTNKFPRILSDVMWGTDNLAIGNNKSPTYGTIIAVTEAYIVMRVDTDGSNKIYIPSPTYTYSNRIITYANSSTYSFNRFVNGMSKLITFYRNFSNQLSLLDLALQSAKAMDWSVGTVPDHIAKKKYSFEIDKQDVYSFFVNTMSHTMKVIFDFDRLQKKVNVIDLAGDDTQYDTGIMTGFQNLLQSVDITTSSTDGIKTTFEPKGGNDLGIEYVNFGSSKITNIDYFINKVDKYGEYQYGTAALHTKYGNWKTYRDVTTASLSAIPKPTYLIPSTREKTYSYVNLNTKAASYTSATLSGTRRAMYIELSKRYNRVLKDINELTYLVPSDGTSTDYTSYPLKDLQTAMTAYSNAYEALCETYKAEYGKSSVVENEIATTYFYSDWKMYHDTIIPNILNALRMYALTDNAGNFKDKNGNTTTSYSDFVYPDGGNPVYNANAELVTKPKSSSSAVWGKSEAYLYDMSLYGLTELNTKKKAWAATAAQAYNADFVKPVGNPPKPGTPGVDAQYNSWGDLSDEQKKKYTNETSYNNLLNKYLDYMSTTVRQNDLTKKNTVGVVVLAANAIKQCEATLRTLQSIQTTLGNARTNLANSVTYEGWTKSVGASSGFTSKELSLLYSFSHEADYVNENILTTNLDDIVTTVAVQEELLQDAQKRLFEKSRPQYSFSTTVDNIMILDEFAPLKSQLKLLNYFYLKYGLFDDETFKLRIVKMAFNPIIKKEDFELGFSNMTYTFEGLDDLIYLFGDSMGAQSSAGSGGRSSGGSGGTYGTNDAEITLSNNMLNALLKNQNTANSLNVNNLMTTQKIENLLVKGDLQINGAAITNVLKSRNYNGSNDSITNTQGSILKLDNGTFNFGGGKMKFDGTTLSVQGNISASNITGSTISGTSISGGIINGTTVSGGTITGTTVSGGTINGTTVTGGTISGATITAGEIQSKDGDTKINLDNDTFSFGKGALTYNGTTLSMKGDITTGSTIEGAVIRGSIIYGVASHPPDWAAGTYEFNIPTAAVLFSYTRFNIYNPSGELDHIEYCAEEHMLVINDDTVDVAQLHDNARFHVSISYVQQNPDGTFKVRVTTSGASVVGLWMINLG